jgi:hypothetical protein
MYLERKNMESSKKAGWLCVAAFIAGLIISGVAGCKAGGKIEGGAELIEMKPLETQELIYPTVLDMDKVA